MNNEEIRKKEEIESALVAMIDGDFLQTSKDLLAVLGYCSERITTLPGTAEDFIRRFPARNRNTETEQEFVDSVESVKLIFQVTSEEIASNDQPSPAFDEGYVRSFTFFAIELKDKDYPRGKYAQFTREVNKRMVMPIVVFFRVRDRLTIGFVGRRQHRRDPDRDVLEQVTLIKDIRLDDPHRAHIEILFELWLKRCAKWMDANNQPENFDGLLAAWLARLDTEELDKKFYEKLFAWYKWAVKEATFPKDKNRTLKPEEHVIRLITRLLFVWFIKEKELVAKELFNEAQISPLLKEYDHDCGDSYYRTVLQNLFFATLNTEIGKRGFSTRTNAKHRDFSRYRYEDQITDPAKLRSLFDQTPFINGGLFDCLDSEEATRDGGYRIDCFSDVDYNKLSIPNRLFFDKDHGLIPLLEHYKFTVEENTPIEQEVALDPELLGKVFENLLAEYNPETGTTARKQTGSYYTPRAIVDYMVDEVLVAVLLQKCDLTEGRLRSLLDYTRMSDNGKTWCDAREADSTVEAISQLKILDPAVGSGAFPMGVLHKLTLALRRLDPGNYRWEQLQRHHARQRAADAFDTKDDQTRHEELLEIDETFKRYRDSDFGRKLYLIQNSIFGVDIQSIACQIAKLRFFISLTIEQEPDRDADNFGIKPLPNLETRFIAANTLIGLEEGQTLTSPRAKGLERELGKNRERHFHATTRPQKLACKRENKKLRQELAAELRHIGMPPDDANRVAAWDPYDQNASADWFDPEWMFGITDGFDVVIGNPPYGLLNKRQNKTIGYLASPEEIQYYKTSYEYTPAMGGMINIFRLFIVKSVHLLNDGGIFSQIFPLAFIGDVSSGNLRKYVLKNYQILGIEAFPERDNAKKRVFEAVKMSVCILSLLNRQPADKFFLRIHRDKFVDIENEKVILDIEDIGLIDKANYAIPLLRGRDLNPIRKIYWKSSVRVVDLGHCYTGEIDLTADKKYLTDDSECAVMIKGAIIDRYLIKREMSQGEVQFLNSRHYLREKRGVKSQHHRKGRIVMQAITGVNERIRLKMTLIEKGIFCANSVNYLVFQNNTVDTKYILALLNSSTLNFVFSKSSTNSNVNGYEIDNLPIVLADKQHQTHLASLVDQILDAKHTDPDADVSELEDDIDQMVYLLYGLTPEEIDIVEGAENV